MAVSDGVAPGALEPADADPVREAADDSAATAVPERAGGRRRRRVVAGWLMLAAGVAILVTAAWVGWRSYQAYGHLQTASSEVSALQEQLKDVTAFDPAQAAETVTRLQDETGAARSAVDDPVYRASTVLPFFGANLHALREVALTVDSLATDVMPSLVDVAQTLQPAQLAPTGRSHRSHADRTDLPAAAGRRRRRHPGRRSNGCHRPGVAGPTRRRSGDQLRGKARPARPT